ncbi:MAG: hypothetical protein GY810_20975 [Aureispira sp.]|nr:hypothetical protein [Aureispira sp.]
MADIEKVKEHVVEVLVNGFKMRNATGKGLDKKINSFWTKFSRRLPEDVVKDMERQPEKPESVKNFTYFLDEQLKKPAIKANVMMFLVNNGIKLF